MKATYFGISELKGLLKIYEQENGERRFSYVQFMEFFKKEKKKEPRLIIREIKIWNRRKEIRLIIGEMKLWDRRIESIKKAIEVLEEGK